MISAFDLLLKYVINLLKPIRPLLWRSINTSSSAFKARVACMKGYGHILRTIGYTEWDGTCLKFPDHVLEPDSTKLYTLISELLMAKIEVEQLSNGTFRQQHNEMPNLSPFQHRPSPTVDSNKGMQTYGAPVHASRNTSASTLEYGQPPDDHRYQISPLSVRDGEMRQFTSIPLPGQSIAETTGMVNLQSPAELAISRYTTYCGIYI